MILQAADIVFGYRKDTLLDGIDLDVATGQLLGLVGPNGAGKSTLLRCLHGALRPRQGTVRLDGAPIAAMSRREVARQIGVVPQSCLPAFPTTVAHFVGMGRFAREPMLGGPRREDESRVLQCLQEMQLADLADRSVLELSGGEFRRVLIAQALAQDPRILLFDEPVQQLDLLHQLEVMEFARAFTRRGDTAGVIVLHDLGLAARYCDVIAVLHRGRIVALGSAEQVFTPATLREVWGVEAWLEHCPATSALQVVPLQASAVRS